MLIASYLPLPLLVLCVFTDDAHHAVAANHLALVANLLNRCPNLHDALNPLEFRPITAEPEQRFSKLALSVLQLAGSGRAARSQLVHVERRPQRRVPVPSYSLSSRAGFSPRGICCSTLPATRAEALSLAATLTLAKRPALPTAIYTDKQFVPASNRRARALPRRGRQEECE
jgi:hypothetical protein